MPSCSSCAGAGVCCLADARQSDYCAECIKYNKPGCNVFGVPVSLIGKIIWEEQKLENLTKIAEREARLAVDTMLEKQTRAR